MFVTAIYELSLEVGASQQASRESARSGFAANSGR
jgi:hypothetical protein